MAEVGVSLPDTVNVVRVRGYLLKSDGTANSRARVVFAPTVAYVVDTENHANIAVTPVVASPDPDTGYWYADVIATNDPDLTPEFAYTVVEGGRDAGLVKVPHDAPTAVVDGASRQAVWLDDLATAVAPTLPATYWTDDQVAAAITEAVAGVGGGAVDSVNGRTGAVTGLAEQADLDALAGTVDGKADTADLAAVATTGVYADLSGTPAIPASFADLSGQVADAQIPAAIARDSEVTAGLAGKSDTGHTHTESDVTGLTSALDAKLNASAVSAYMLTVLDDTNAAAARATLGITAGGDTSGIVQLPSLAAGEENLPRQLVNQNTLASSLGSLRLNFWRARKSFTSTQIRTYSGFQAASSATLIKLGLYSINESTGAGTLVASTANDTTLFGSLLTAYTRSWISGVGITAGNLYAWALIVVGSGNAGQFLGVNSQVTAENALLCRAAGYLAGQSDLPASFTDASLTSSGAIYYGVILP